MKRLEVQRPLREGNAVTAGARRTWYASKWELPTEKLSKCSPGGRNAYSASLSMRPTNSSRLFVHPGTEAAAGCLIRRLKVDNVCKATTCRTAGM